LVTLKLYQKLNQKNKYFFTRFAFSIFVYNLTWIIKGFVGFVKNKINEKVNQFRSQYFFVTIAISGIAGTRGGILVETE